MLFNQIYNDYINARKERNQKKSEFLGYLCSELANQAKKEKKEKLDDQETVRILKKQEKKLKETVQSCQNSQRKDIQENLKSELEILSAYLPQPLGQEETNRIINEIIAKNQAESLSDMGKIMKIILEKIGTRSNPQQISQIVREKLSSK